MQQMFLLQILLLAENVSVTTMPIIRSSRVLYSGCCLWYFVLQLENHSTKYHRQQPVYNTLELLMMGIVVPETC